VHLSRRAIRRLLLAAVAVVAALAAPDDRVAAQVAVQSSPGGRVVRAERARGALRIDGRLDDEAWARARPTVESFTQAVPSSGAPATERTEVRVLFDRNALYVGFRLYDSRPDSIAAQLARRDAGGIYTDWAHVAIDSYHDRRTAWRFSLNPRGVQGDGGIYNDTERDPLWDAVWEGAATTDSLGWTPSSASRSRSSATPSTPRGRRACGGSTSRARSRGAASAPTGRPRRPTRRASCRAWARSWGWTRSPTRRASS
jgi:hypothetical protein